MKRSGVLTSLGLLLLGVAASAAASSALGPSQWTQYRMNPTNNAVFDNGGGTLPDRHFGIGDQVRATPVIVGNRLFIGAHESGGMFSFNVVTGKKYWGNLGPTWRHAPNWIHSDMIFANGHIFVGYGNRIFDSDRVRGTGASGVLGVDPKTGEIIWDHSTLGEVMPTPAYWQGHVYAATGGGKLLALDARTGHLDWSLELPGWVSMSSPNIDGHRLYVGSLNSVVAVDLETHKKLWEYDEYGSFTDVSPAVSASGVVVITAKKSRDQLTQAEAEQYKHVRGNLQFIYGLDAETGKLLWKTLMGGGPDQDNNTSGAPAIAGNRVYVGSPYTDTFYAFDVNNGTMIWQVNENAAIKGAPAIKDGLVFFGDTKGYLYVLDADTGARVRRKSGYVVPKLKIGGSVSAARGVALAPGGPVVINQNVFVGSQDGFVYSVSIPGWLRN